MAKRRKNKRTKSNSNNVKKETLNKLTENIPKVELKGNVNFDKEFTYSDFEKINNPKPKGNKIQTNEMQENRLPENEVQTKNKPDIDDETLKKQKAMEETTLKAVKTQKYSDIMQTNADIINDIDSGTMDKYFTSAIINKENNSDIMETLHILADENNSNAQNMLGVCYLTGMNVVIDEKKAVEYLNSAAEQDHTAAQRNLAITLENQQSADKNKIIALYEKAAEKDDSYALNNLAVCYLIGDGVKQNIKQAVKYFEKAVKYGDDFAMVNLADCYAVGNGVSKSDKKAFELYKQAADKGNLDGLKNAADCLMNGIGVKQNFRAAMDYYRKAADFGDTKALEKFNELSEKLNPQKHSDITLSDNDNKGQEKKKPTLSEKFNLSKKVSENKENKENEKAQENKEKAVSEKKKDTLAL